MRAAWTTGANYDRSQLQLFLADPGFILGQSKLGQAKLGTDGPELAEDLDFTSITINSQTTVEDGLFVHREVETCTLTATLPAMVDLRGRRIAIRYAGIPVYKGTVREVQWDEAVDLASWRPGNTATKTYRVSLLATSGEEVLTTTATPSRQFIGNESLEARVESWTGLAATTDLPAFDLPVNTHNIGWDGDTSVSRLVFPTDASRTLLETLRDEAKLRNMSFTYRPWETTPITLVPNNRWLAGGSSADSLVFTDDPSHDPQEVDEGDDFLHLGRFVSYSSRSVGEDSGMFANSVAVKFGQWDLFNPPAEPEEFAFGPYRTTGANPSDVVVDLGTMDVENPSQNGFRVARNFVATLPLRIASAPFTRSLAMPLQSTAQIVDQVPGLALLEHDGQTERVAVLGRSHTITPTRWLVSYDLGPHHLLDRDSDLDPGTPEFVSASFSAGTFQLSWKTPHLPSDVPLYRHIFWTASGKDTQLTSWDATFSARLANQVVRGEVPGDLQSVSIPDDGTHTTKTVFVAYTSNPTPNNGSATDIWREGQPLEMGTFLVT